MNRLATLRAAGVSIWLDTLSRELLESGGLAQHIRDHHVTGATSNPAIFADAMRAGERYATQLDALARAGLEDPREGFLALALEDVRQAAQLFRPAHDEAAGRDGFVSLQCTPDLADDAGATVAQALELWRRLDAPNVMIKVPATAAGMTAVEELTARGVNVNVTLLFSVDRHKQAMEAYLCGLERRVATGLPVRRIASVASFFVSRIDSRADAVLPAGHPSRGEVAVANAQLAYRGFLESFAGERWAALRAHGAVPQRPLWASTGTKNPAYSDVLYVERLVAPGAISTMPASTLHAFADHGEVRDTLGGDPGEARRVLADAADAGLDLARVTAELERDGVQAFRDAYARILDVLGQRLETSWSGAV